MKKDDHKSCVYILANRHRNVLYVGCTDNLKKRIYFHKNKLLRGFTQKYNIETLVYVEWFQDSKTAYDREAQIKKFKKEKKYALVMKVNPQWDDLYFKIMGEY